MEQTVLKITSPDQKESLGIEPSTANVTVPPHVAIMMDGNRRWAQARGLPVAAGYAAGVKALWRTVRAAARMGIGTLTVYGFSTENWSRSIEEVDVLIEQIEGALLTYTDEMIREGVRLRTIGDLSRFPTRLVERIREVELQTMQGQDIELVVALNYGGRNEICRAARRIVNETAQGNLREEQINEELFASYLDTASLSDPDLLIRTSGEMRLSNFLLWQISYAEFWPVNTLWPDFGAKELDSAIQHFKTRNRRCGC